MEFNNPSTLIKDITSGEEAKTKIANGVNILANAVKSTLGASGKCVIYEDAMGKPIITKDGVTVAESITLWDPVENMGATMVKEAAANTVRDAGDGTTTAIVLAQALLKELNESVSKDSPREIREGIDRGLTNIITYLDAIKIPIKGKMLDNVAAISCNNDPILGKLISEAFNQAGENGEVLMEESEDETTYTTITKGIQIMSGLKSPYLRTNVERETAELDNPLVLILTSPLANVRKIQFVLEHCIKNGRALLIIGELEPQPLATLVSNKVRGVLKINIIDLPGFGPTKQDTVTDIAIMTGATPISEELGDDMDFIDLSVLGEVERSVTTHQKTIMQPSTLSVNLEARIIEVKKKVKKEKNAYIKKKLEDRLNILSGSVSIIKVGAESKIELKEKKDRIEDAIYAVKAAIQEGIVPGGGVALLNASYCHVGIITDGQMILSKAIQAPFNAILENADISLKKSVQKKIEDKEGIGIDVVTGELVNMVKQGIIDPVLVTKTALKNAVSVIMTIVSADTILSNRRAITE